MMSFIPFESRYGLAINFIEVSVSGNRIGKHLPGNRNIWVFRFLFPKKNSINLTQVIWKLDAYPWVSFLDKWNSPLKRESERLLNNINQKTYYSWGIIRFSIRRCRKCPMPCGFSYGLAIGFTQNYAKRSKVVFALSWKLEHANVPVSFKY
jgi:hypothetical protein